MLIDMADLESEDSNEEMRLLRQHIKFVEEEASQKEEEVRNLNMRVKLLEQEAKAQSEKEKTKDHLLLQKDAEIQDLRKALSDLTKK